MSGEEICELAARGLHVRLGGRAVLDGIDLAFRSGEVTAVVGPNGAGKSTLMTCLAGLRLPDGGGVSLGGAALAKLGDRERARRIGYLPQAPAIAWRLDVRTFVRLGRTAHRGVFGQGAGDAVAGERALARTSLTAFAGRDVATLSGGERARVLIARALAGDPAWLLADEPLTGLDLGHQLDAAELLRVIARSGAGVVVTVHDLAFAARVADRVVVMAGGQVIADGRATQALSPQVLSSAYAVDAGWLGGEGGPLLDVRGRRG
jgi:iron complex transport system ATP-binding protein